MTATTQATLGDWAPVGHDRHGELDDDPSPRGVVRAAIGAAMAIYVHPVRVTADRPFRVLDLGAGFGCWASEFARWWVHVLGLPREWLHITGVELNPDREPHLRKWCDEVVSQSWEWMRPGGYFDGEESAYDLVIGNPPFAHLLRQGRHEDPNKRTDYMPVEQTMVPTLLRHAPAVLLLHADEAFTKSEHGREAWRAYPPATTWLVGPLGFRGPGHGMAPTCYQASLWLRGHKGPCSTYMLPELTSDERRWTVPPGSESVAEAAEMGLPLAPGYAP